MSTTPEPNTSQPWDRLPRESGVAYEAFLIYRDLGPTRSLYKAARKRRATRPHPSPNLHQQDQRGSQWKTWFSKWRWEERAQAWDKHNDVIAQQARDRETERQTVDWEQRRVQWREKQIETARLFSEHLTKQLQSSLDAKSLRLLASVATLASDLTQRVLGDVDASDPDADFDPKSASVEELEAFIARCEERRERSRRNRPDTTLTL